MKATQLLGAFVLFAAATVQGSFAQGGNLPENHFIFGPPGGSDASKIAKRATTSTSDASDPNCSNGPLSRNCWTPGYSAATDFDAKYPTTGVTRYYTLTISNTTCNPDGSSPKKVCLLINGGLPGPLIRANWGDMLSITVNNNMKYNGTTLHWHGLRQLGTNTEDGVGGITECALAPGQSRTYNFQATQFGTSWYHSHFSAQYGEGVMGPIVIDGPSSANWDIDLGPLTLSDWHYESAYVADLEWSSELQLQAPGPAGDNILLNGTNMNPAGTTGKYLKTKLTKGKKHLLRLVNMSVDNAIRVSLDNHTMQVVTADFVPVQPITVDSLLLHVGQRYEIIINANQTAGNYWFRAEAETTGCLSYNNGVGMSIFTYSGAKVATPTTSSSYTNGGVCDEPSPLTPWVANQVGDEATFIAQASNLDVSLVVPGMGTNNQSIVVWGINASAMDISWSKPTLSYVMADDSNFPATENLIELATEGIWVFWIIQEVQPNVDLAHPIHLHGHDFYVLGSGTGTFDISSDPANLQYTNPKRRDTTILPAGGWLVLAFPTDNPGAWLMHCHIAWHITEGLGVQFLEAATEINLPGTAYTNQCAKWSAFQPTMPYEKFGSGL